jgi:N-acetylmuramic acid 6-phosphate (MurNAc-6-P) etherase
METLGVHRGEGARLLDRAEGHVKTAIVMGRLGVDRDEARRRLEEAGGVITRVTGELHGAEAGEAGPEQDRTAAGRSDESR